MIRDVDQSPNHHSSYHWLLGSLALSACVDELIHKNQYGGEILAQVTAQPVDQMASLLKKMLVLEGRPIPVIGGVPDGRYYADKTLSAKVNVSTLCYGPNAGATTRWGRCYSANR